MSKWLTFQKQLRSPGRKTDVFTVLNKVSGTELGEIKWYGGFRKFVFAPFPNIIFDADCLKDIAAYLSTLMLERKIEKQSS